MEIIKQLAHAKKLIKETKMKKEGKNTYSNYEYFTPSQVEKLVSDACESSDLLTMFELKRNELGVYGVLTVYSLKSEEKLSFEMSTAIPEIKATNIAQQLGGCMTYTERYLKQSVFGITDNSIDFDATEITKKQNDINKQNYIIGRAKIHIKNCRTIEDLEKVKNYLITPELETMYKEKKEELSNV